MSAAKLSIGAAVVAAVAIAAAGLSSCTRTNTTYCEADTDCESGFACDLIARACEFDGRDAGDGTGCTSSATCPDDMPICSVDRQCETCAAHPDCAERSVQEPWCSSDGACVQCLDDGDCAEATASFCDTAASVCRGCLGDQECSSEACNRDLGTCADSDGILYVDNASGADSDSCGAQAQPCATIAGVSGALPKVGAGRRTIRVRSGSQAYPESLVLNGISVVILGRGAVLAPIVINTPALTVSGGANVTIDGLTLRGASGSADADGVRCEGADSILRLTGTVVQDNAGQGVDVSAGCDLRITRSLIRANRGGGISTMALANEISHSMIVDNGSPTSALGGLLINTAGAPQDQRLEFNTIAGNQRVTGAGGIACGSPLTVANSILWANSGAQANASCSFIYSDVAGGAAGDGNIDSGPIFAADNDYHLSSGSPCIDAADPLAGLGIDIDGEDRPVGGRADMGADESVGDGT